MSMLKPRTRAQAVQIKRCPECKSKEIEIAVYPDGKKFLECIGCYSVIMEIKVKN